MSAPAAPCAAQGTTQRISASPVFLKHVEHRAVASVRTYYPQPSAISVAWPCWISYWRVHCSGLPIGLHAFVVIQIPEKGSIDTGFAGGAEDRLRTPAGPSNELILV